MSSGRIFFGCARCAFLAITPPRGSEILAGDEIDAALKARCCFAVAGVLRALQLHAEPRQERPPPALRRRDLDRRADVLRRDAAGAQLHAIADKPRPWFARRLPLAAPLEVVGISALLGACAFAQRFETAARFEDQTRDARRAAHELGARHEVGPSGGGQLR